jgi:hypothetical protein
LREQQRRRHPEHPAEHRRGYGERLEERHEEDERRASGPERYTVRR